MADGLICPSCQSVAVRSLVTTGKSLALVRASRALKRGASRSSRTLGAGCDGCGWCQAREPLRRTKHHPHTAKSCGPDASTLASRRRINPPVTVTKTPDHRGEHEGNRKTNRAGNAGLFWRTCGDLLVCISIFSHARLRVRVSTRHSLRPLLSEGAMNLQSSGEIASRECGGVPCSRRSFRGDAKHQTRNLEIPG